ncbi:predicted protein [Nematostella vectensis]|uniref:Transmembrane protein 229B n=1 Tax=Nematostella vectensis TaxID=45351 RepID=A7SB37_NEMVE|nr:predicted protein [Nematostella vectensis]|eukprot:XP_001631156.1 predicted protein [Nematostella vectensis]
MTVGQGKICDSCKSPSSGATTKIHPSSSCLPVASRLILYGLCGFFAEVMFTATWYFVDSAKYRHGWKLHGCTSVWSFPIYSLSSYVVEKMFLCLDGKVHIFIRGFIYLVWTYLWEFSTGWILRQFNACPWDYSDYTYWNIMGLITFDYAPLWYFGSLLLEIVVIQSALQLQYKTFQHRKID